VAGGCCEPTSDFRGVAEPVEALDQPKPRDLHNVGAVRVTQPVRADSGPNQSAELVDESIPTGFVASTSRQHQRRYFLV
jgi:hypothetical protein